MRGTVEANSPGAVFSTKQREELHKIAQFQRSVNELPSKSKAEAVCANRLTIQRAIEETAAIKLNCDIYTSLLALKIDSSVKAQRDLADLQSQVSGLVESFLKDRGYL